MITEAETTCTLEDVQFNLNDSLASRSLSVRLFLLCWAPGHVITSWVCLLWCKRKSSSTSPEANRIGEFLNVKQNSLARQLQQKHKSEYSFLIQVGLCQEGFLRGFLRSDRCKAGLLFRKPNHKGYMHLTCCGCFFCTRCLVNPACMSDKHKSFHYSIPFRDAGIYTTSEKPAPMLGEQCICAFPKLMSSCCLPQGHQKAHPCKSRLLFRKPNLKKKHYAYYVSVAFRAFVWPTPTCILSANCCYTRQLLTTFYTKGLCTRALPSEVHSLLPRSLSKATSAPTDARQGCCLEKQTKKACVLASVLSAVGMFSHNPPCMFHPKQFGLLRHSLPRCVLPTLSQLWLLCWLRRPRSRHHRCSTHGSRTVGKADTASEGVAATSARTGEIAKCLHALRPRVAKTIPQSCGLPHEVLGGGTLDCGHQTFPDSLGAHGWGQQHIHSSTKEVVLVTGALPDPVLVPVVGSAGTA